jgi:hypothetical protein
MSIDWLEIIYSENNKNVMRKFRYVELSDMVCMPPIDTK